MNSEPEDLEAQLLEELQRRGIDIDAPELPPDAPEFIPDPKRLIQGILDGLRPEPRGTVTEWADTNRWLSSEASKEYGRYSSSRVPYLREIMDALSPSSGVQFVIFQKGSQLGASEAAYNTIGTYMDWFPCPMMIYNPTDMDMRKNSEIRVSPMIEACPTLKAKVSPTRSRSKRNSMLFKSGPGFILTMAGANSPSPFASIAGRVVVLDEYDRMPSNVGNEGSPLGLVEARTSTFSTERKIFILSTPTTSASKIAALYSETDQRKFHVPCPHCNELQVLEWDNFRYTRLGEDDYRCTVFCINCAAEIEERHKTWMLENGRWVSTRPEMASAIKRGYHLSSLYSPLGWLSWATIAAKHDKAYNVTNDQNEQITFRNTILGEIFTENQERPAWESLRQRAGRYYKRNQLPDGTAPAAPGKPLFITCGCDVQRDRVELSIVAWGIGKESWRVDYRVIHGDTANPADPCWEGLASVMSERWQVSGIRMPVALTAIDCSDQTKVVTAVVQGLNNRGFRIIPVMGRANQVLSLHKGPPMHETPDGKRWGEPIYFVGVSVLKHELYGYLRLQPLTDGSHPAGYCHFPDYGDDYFQSLTAEAVVVEVDKQGYPKEVWKKLHPRNEALDCDVYAAAAADFNRMRSYNAAQMDILRGQGWVGRETEPKEADASEKAGRPRKPPPKDSIWNR